MFREDIEKYMVEGIGLEKLDQYSYLILMCLLISTIIEESSSVGHLE